MTMLAVAPPWTTALSINLRWRDADSVWRDRPIESATPSTASCEAVNARRQQTRQRRNPHSVRRAASPHLPRFPCMGFVKEAFRQGGASFFLGQFLCSI
jgi:hypothetical protein